MDIISRAIKKELHISKSEKLNQQTWEEFEEECKNKEVFLFGVGAACEMLLLRFKGGIEIEGVLENDTKKHGFTLDTYVPEMVNTVYANASINSVSILEKYSADEVVILIASTNYYEAIIEQLEGMGFSNHFVILIMEANKRSKDGYKKDEIDDQQRRAAYITDCCKREIDKKKVVFYAYGTYADHGKYITQALLSIRNDLDIVWLVKDLTISVPDGVRLVYIGNWKNYIYEMETAKVWIFDRGVPDYIEKRQGQIYIQAKHWASITLKRCYLDAVTLQSAPLVEGWKRNSKMIDYIFTGSSFDTAFCRRAFAFDKDVIEVGSPRSDIIIKIGDSKRKVYSHYQIDENAHTLLYAPTFRFQEGEIWQQEIGNVELDFDRLLYCLKKKWGGEWYILFRAHPGVASKSSMLNLPNGVIDVSQYIDSQELVAASDVTISDYSSIMFEPAFGKRPVFLFATDRKSYIDKQYDLLLNYDSLPFDIAESNKQLEEAIMRFEQVEYEKRIDNFLKQYGVHEDGHASERAAAFVSNLLI